MREKTHKKGGSLIPFFFCVCFLIMARKVNWEQIKTEYITTDISQRNLAEKYGIARSTLQFRANKEKWFDLRQKSKAKAVKKAVQKAETKQANVLAKELTLLDKLERHLDKALSDAEQFNRHIVTEGVGKGATETTEQIFSKADMRALKDAAQVLTMIEKIKKDNEAMKAEPLTVKFGDGSGDDWGE